MIVSAAGSLPLPEPMIVSRLLTVTFSLYVPGATLIVSPALAALTAAWIVLHSRVSVSHPLSSARAASTDHVADDCASALLTDPSVVSRPTTSSTNSLGRRLRVMGQPFFNIEGLGRALPPRAADEDRPDCRTGWPERSKTSLYQKI